MNMYWVSLNIYYVTSLFVLNYEEMQKNDGDDG